MTVAIIGLGLIGGSIAKAIKKRTSHRVLGFDKSESVLVTAYQNGAIDDICTDFSDVDISLIALYPNTAVNFIKANAGGFRPNSTVIDLCGVKRHICSSLREVLPEDVTFIGGHPMAGRECSGFENSTETLFDGASMILTPDEDIGLTEIEEICSFFTGIGFGHIEIATPEHHDEMIAYTSQLAHIVSNAYVKNPIAMKFVGFSAGSFADMTRVAKLNEEMWTELFMHNSDYLQHQIGVFIDNLSDFRKALRSHDEKLLCGLLRDGREAKEALDAELYLV